MPFSDYIALPEYRNVFVKMLGGNLFPYSNVTVDKKVGRHPQPVRRSSLRLVGIVSLAALTAYEYYILMHLLSYTFMCIQ
jgi:hypothetical protein